MSGWKAGAKEGKQASKQEGSVSARKLGDEQLRNEGCSSIVNNEIHSDVIEYLMQLWGGTPNRNGPLVIDMERKLLGLNYN